MKQKQKESPLVVIEQHRILVQNQMINNTKSVVQEVDEELRLKKLTKWVKMLEHIEQDIQFSYEDSSESIKLSTTQSELSDGDYIVRLWDLKRRYMRKCKRVNSLKEKLCVLQVPQDAIENENDGAENQNE